MSCGVSLWVGVGVNLLQGHDVVNGFLHFIRMDAEGRLQQLEKTQRRQKGKQSGNVCKQISVYKTERHNWKSYVGHILILFTDLDPYLILGVPQRWLWKEMVAKH